MSRTLILVTMGLVVIICLVSVVSSKYWYPGITKSQTTYILLNDQKFGARAFKKAVWHGDDIFSDIYKITDRYSEIDFYQAKVINRLIIRIDKIDMDKHAKPLSKMSGLYAKLFGTMMMVKGGDKEVCRESFPFLNNIIKRKNPELESSFLNKRDYYSEIAITVIGYCGGTKPTRLLRAMLYENSVPYSVHKATIDSMVIMNDPKFIKDLHTRILDQSFFVTGPAYMALVSLGDPNARDYAKKRLKMKTGGDDYLLVEYLDNELN